MNEDTKKVEEINKVEETELEGQSAELLEQDLDKIAGGTMRVSGDRPVVYMR